MKIAIIGAGWYGSHIACSLKKSGHEVFLFEKNSDIFSDISGKFGIRLHAGPHYPRSLKTRESCHRAFEEFYNTYPELIVEHEYSVYGLGDKDADEEPSKVNLQTFKAVCEESKDFFQIAKPESWGYRNLIAAMNIKEPSILVGNQLREMFKHYLKSANVKVVCNFEVKKLERHAGKIAINVAGRLETFDYLINATSFHTLLPEQSSLPFNMEVVYQPCLALVYEDNQLTERPFSFIVMDGWFPCIMPFVDSKEGKNSRQQYILTHGKWTIMGSFKSVDEASNILSHLSDSFIENNVKPWCESEAKKFWPEFEKRFKYIKWQGSVLAKIKTNKEFRSAVTFASKDVIYIIPGKISNIFDAEREVVSLINKQNIISDGDYQYIQDGVLHEAMVEITEKINDETRNTCALQTYKELETHAKKNQNILSYVPHFFQPIPANKEKDEVMPITVPIDCNFKP